jgi:hypothetical protein
MDFDAVSRAAALFRMQVTQPSGSRPCAPRTTAKALTEDDTAELPTFGVQRGAAVAECDCLQLGQPVAAPGTAQKDRQLVADEPAAAVGENRRSAGETCPGLLAAFGGESSDAAALRSYGAADRVAALASRLESTPGWENLGNEQERGRGVREIAGTRVKVLPASISKGACRLQESSPGVSTTRLWLRTSRSGVCCGGGGC